jgi:uncharacterized coiled-coil protein SlyX
MKHMNEEYIKELEARIENLTEKSKVQDRLIESLMVYIQEISPVEPEHVVNHRKVARAVIHGEGL